MENTRAIAEQILKQAEDQFDVEAYTGYESLMKNFNYNDTTIERHVVEQDGNDMDGFSVEVSGTMSNGITFAWEHNKKGVGTIKVKTKNGTEILSKKYNLSEIGTGYSEVLQGYLKRVLDFNF
jgi:hypothetical protein